MKQTKDNFSNQASVYSKFRPRYPARLYEFLYDHCTAFGQALDMATGNGQVASALSTHFNKVFATDISQSQIDQAHQAENISYSLQRAESTDFEDNSFDLITVGQAYHWFDFEAFGKEANRLLKPEGIIAIWTYGLLRITPELDTFIDDFYLNTTDAYWDSERKWVEENYQTVPFPFTDIRNDFSFDIQTKFTIEQLTGYLNTWSAVQHFIKKEGYNPVDNFIEKIKVHWTDEQTITFPGAIRLGSRSDSFISTS